MRSPRSRAFIQRVTNGIRAVREAHGQTQDEVAEKMGIGTRSYQKMESTANLTLDTIMKIADRMGIAPDELLLTALAAPRKTYPHRASSTATLHDSSTSPAKPKRTRRMP